MITVTMQGWQWLLFCLFLVPVVRFAEWSGNKVGHATYRWLKHRRDAKLIEWSRRG